MFKSIIFNPKLFFAVKIFEFIKEEFPDIRIINIFNYKLFLKFTVSRKSPINLFQDKWNERFENAPLDVQRNIHLIINELKEKFDVIVEPHRKYLYLYVAKPTERKTLFAVVNCGKNSANVMFRVNPELFNNESEYVRSVVGWFFPRETERRISIKDKHIPKITKCLEHAYHTTSNLLKKTLVI